MRGSLSGAVWRLGIFLTVCAFFLFSMFAVFSHLRFDRENHYSAVFTNVSGLQAGQFVRIGGVEVGKVQSVVIQPDTTVVVDFGVDESVVLTHGTRAVIRYDDLIGGRYLALEEGAGGTRRLPPGGTIPLSNTSPALDLDALIGGFRPLFRALDPDQVNALSGQLISAFQGQGDTINAFFTQTAALTTKLGDRDRLIGEVITNLNTVLGSLSDENTQFAKAVEALSKTVGTLAEHKDDISTSIAYTNDAAGAAADLLSQARQPTREVLAETDRVSGLIAQDRAYLDSLLSTLPSKYQTLSRFGLYGDYFSFYLCDAVLKVNGKGGQPVFIKVAGQDSGRCAPR
jgi:phospholipid/cholesterol/gamma-HCH transport system substrate-binding protein